MLMQRLIQSSLLTIAFFTATGISSPAWGQCQQNHIKANAVTGCAPYIVSLEAISVPAQTSANWIIGQDTFPNRKKVSQAFRNAKSMDVTLQLKQGDSLICQQTKRKLIKVYGKPSDFSLGASKTKLCNGPDTVTFNLNNGSADQYDWIVNNERYTDQGTTLTHAFTKTGKKTVSIQGKSQHGCVSLEEFESFVKVHQNPEVSASAKSNKGTSRFQTTLQLTPADSFKSVSWTAPRASDLKNTSTNNPLVSYNKPGSYQPRVEAESWNGCTYTDTVKPTIRVVEPARLDFKASKTRICPGTAIRLLNQSVPQKGSYSWTVTGAGVKKHLEGRSPAVTLSKGGEYEVTLTYTYHDVEQSVTKSDVIKVRDFNAGFTATPACNCSVPAKVSLNNQISSNSGIQYQWNIYNQKGAQVFGSQKANPEFLARTQGTYDVALVAESSQGCRDSVYQADYLQLGKLTKSLDLDFQTYAVNQPIHLDFPDDSFCTNDSLNVTWLVWNNTKTQLLKRSRKRNPKFSFQDSGIYRLSLKVSTKDGCQQSVSTGSGNPLDIKDPSPDFGIDTGQGNNKNPDTDAHAYCKDEAFTLVQQTVPTALNYTHQWQITHQRDSTVQVNGTGETFKTRLKKPGVYDVTYTAAVDSVTAFQKKRKGYLVIRGAAVNWQTQTVNHCIPFKAKVKAKLDSQNTYPAPTAVQRQYRWHEADASGITVAGEGDHKATVKVQEPGSYGVGYTIKGPMGCKDHFKPKNLIRAGVKANFSIPAHKCFGEKATATNQSFTPGNNPEYRWLSADKGLEQVKPFDATNQVFSFSDSGNYEVRLAVETKHGCKDTQRATVHVERVFASFTTDDTLKSCAPVVVDFDVNSSNNVNRYQWDFGDGQTQQTRKENISKVYQKNSGDSTSGFTIGLTAISNNGCRKTVTRDRYVTVLGPVIDFVLDKEKGCSPLDVELQLSGKNYVAAYASYDDQSNLDTAPDLRHTYQLGNQKRKERFKPFVLAKDKTGCVAASEADAPLTVLPKPEANFSLDTAKGCYPVEVNFRNTTTMPVKKTWHTTDTAQPTEKGIREETFSHNFAQGQHSVTMIAETRKGCRDTLSFTDTIHAFEHPKVDFSISSKAICPGSSFELVNQSQGQGQALVDHQWIVESPEGMDTLKKTNLTGLTYQQQGEYDVTLNSVNEKGCQETLTREDLINIISRVEEAPELQFASYQPNADPATQAHHKTISWNATQEEAFDQYKVLGRAIGDQEWKPVASVKDRQTTQITDPNQSTDAYRLMVEGQCGFFTDTTAPHSPASVNIESTEAFTNTLSWTDYQGWETVSGYKIMRTRDHGQYELIDTVSGQTNKYQDTELCRGDYHYQVVALHPNHSYQSWSQPATQAPLYTRPTFPKPLINTTVKGGNLITTWKQPDSWEPEGYRVKRKSLQASQWKTIAQSTDQAQCTDGQVAVEKQAYEYKVQALNHCKEPSLDAGISSSIYLEANPSGQNVELTWKTAAEWKRGVQYYEVQLKKPGVGYQTFTTLDGKRQQYTDDKAWQAIDTTLTYRLKAHRSTGLVAASNAASATKASTLYIPNAFTPNGDGKNDAFKVEGQALRNFEGQGFESFELKIYNQWGERIFQSKDPQRGWDGTDRSGRKVSSDQYTYTLYAVSRDGQTFSRQGTVTLLR